MRQTQKQTTDCTKIIGKEVADGIYKSLFGDKSPNELSRKEKIELGRAIHKEAAEKLSETGMTNSEIGKMIGLSEANIRAFLTK